MKLVNPDYLGFEIDYAFIGIELKCKQFKDPYSSRMYAATGCYACKNLSIEGHTGMKCEKNNAITHIPIRKDDANMIIDNCPGYSSRHDRYGRSGCSSCKNRYWGNNRPKCRLGYEVREEIIRM